MTLKVYNFYANKKLSTNKYFNVLMSDVTFYVIVSGAKGIRELAIHIPKKYHYEYFVEPKEYAKNKGNEYNVLIDFLYRNRKEIEDKWELNRTEYLELLEGLELCLIKDYSNANFLMKKLKEVKVLLKVLVNRFRRVVK